jgi:hypothetical protein
MLPHYDVLRGRSAVAESPDLRLDTGGQRHQLMEMTRRIRRSSATVPLVMAQLTMASWEVIARRSMMMLANTCSPAEYRRMVREKQAAAAATATRVAMTGGAASLGALLAPWHSRATANVKRLRKR